MKLLLRLSVLLLLALSALWFPRVASVRAEGITVESSLARSAFPDGISFTLSASSSTNVVQTRLRYRLMPRLIESSVRGECEGQTRVTCKVTVGGSIGSAVYIVPFAEVRYSWEITDSAGQTLSTPEASVFYDDIRFRWRSVSDGNLTVHFYNIDEAAARPLLAVGRETIDSISALLGTHVDFPIKVLEYANVRDLQEASARGRRSGGNSVLLGQAVTDDTVISTQQVFGSGADPLDTLRHELAHLVTGEAVNGGGIDPWINEGISMYAQRVVEGSYTRALERAIRSDSVYQMLRLNASSTRTNDADTFYAQAHSMVKFLIEDYGQPKFRDFMRALKTKETDEAFLAVYGIDSLGFENAWRRSVGLGPVSLVSSTPVAREHVVLAPIDPLGAQAPTPAAASSGARDTAARSDDGGASTALPIAGAVVSVAVLSGAGMLLMRRKKA